VAMPVILTTPAEVDRWLAADAPKALELQRSLPEDALRMVASEPRARATAMSFCGWRRRETAPHGVQRVGVVMAFKIDGNLIVRQGRRLQ
jgi:hypothetical protein